MVSTNFYNLQTCQKTRQTTEVRFSITYITPVLNCHDLTTFFNRMRISNDSKICQDYHCAVMNVNRIINCHYLLRNYDVVINCMGLGGDTNLTPIRRQTLKGTNYIINKSFILGTSRYIHI